MMTTKICPVCHTKYESGDCPVCKFPDIAFPGDPEEGLRLMKPQIDAYREVFLLKLKIGVVSYYWKDQDGSLVLDREQITPLGQPNSSARGRSGFRSPLPVCRTPSSLRCSCPWSWTGKRKS